MPLQKEASIIHMADRLRKCLGAEAFKIVDHWENDLCAIGIAKPTDHSVLVYISTFNLPSGAYDVELELPPNAGEEERIYRTTGAFQNVSFTELVAIIQRHFAENQ